eukprot:4830767-Pleurochrysis_carterae.AAC.1
MSSSVCSPLRASFGLPRYVPSKCSRIVRAIAHAHPLSCMEKVCISSIMHAGERAAHQLRVKTTVSFAIYAYERGCIRSLIHEGENFETSCMERSVRAVAPRNEITHFLSFCDSRPSTMTPSRCATATPLSRQARAVYALGCVCTTLASFAQKIEVPPRYH